MDVAVRDLVEDDRQAWETLWAVYLDHYEQDLPTSVTGATWERVTGGDPRMHGLGAFAAGGLVGLAHYVLGPSTWDVADDCYLEDLVVAPDVRGRGVGRALIDELRRRGDAGGWRRIHWLTEESNATARRLYDTVGTLTPYVRYEIDLAGDGSGAGSARTG